MCYSCVTHVLLMCYSCVTVFRGYFEVSLTQGSSALLRHYFALCCILPLFLDCCWAATKEFPLRGIDTVLSNLILCSLMSSEKTTVIKTHQHTTTTPQQHNKIKPNETSRPQDRNDWPGIRPLLGWQYDHELRSRGLSGPVLHIEITLGIQIHVTV